MHKCRDLEPQPPKGLLWPAVVHENGLVMLVRFRGPRPINKLAEGPIHHASVKEPLAPPRVENTFTTNHTLRGDDCKFVMFTVCVSKEVSVSVHVLPLDNDGYELGFVLVLQNTLVILLKSLDNCSM